MLAALPDGVSDAQAATLPVAGLTALRALDIIGAGARPARAGHRRQRRGGAFAVQLAKLAGAHVTGVAANPERAQGVIELGADEVIAELQTSGPEFDGIVEGVGGATLGAALQRVAAGGTVVSFASSDTAAVQYPSARLFGRAPGARLYGLLLFDALARERSGARDLTRLAELVASGRLRCSVELDSSWRGAADAVAALLERRVAGKIVLRVD